MKKYIEKIKSTRNPEETKGRILSEATKVFAKYGFEGAPISDIFKASKVNKRMIYHYFGDKSGLYREVFVAQWGEMDEWFKTKMAEKLIHNGMASMHGKELLITTLGIFFDFMASHSLFVRLMMWEGLEGGDISISIWKDIRGPLFDQIEALIKLAQEEGTLDPKYDAGHIVINFMGAVTFYFAHAPSLADVIRADPLSGESLIKRKQQVMQLFEGLFK